MKLFFGLTLISFVFSFTVENDCSLKGPSYWCQSKSTAIKCQATNYCENHVWLKGKSAKDVDLCATCKQEVNMLHAFIEKNETYVMIISFLKQECDMFPSSVRDACNGIVGVYATKIIDYIVMTTSDAQASCTQFGLCTAFMSFVDAKKDLMLDGTDYCLTCQQYVGTLHLIISNKGTKDEIISELKNSCSLVQNESYKQICTVLVDTFASKAFDWLIDYTGRPISFCTLLQLCKASFIPLVRGVPMINEFGLSMKNSDLVIDMIANVMLKAQKEVKQTQPKSVSHKNVSPKSVSCELCTMAMSSLEDILKGNETKAEVKQALEQVCGFLPASLKSECDQLVDAYSDQIVDLIVIELSDPNAICKQIGLCTSKINKVIKQKTVNSVTCELCTMAMSSLENILKGNESKAEIKQALEQVCGSLPTSVKSECDQLVDTYSDDIVDLIIQLTDPNTICKQIGLCASKIKKVIKQKTVDSVTCELCTMAMSSLESILKGNESKAEIKQALEQVCGLLPSSVKSECDQFVDTYSDKIVDLIIQLADPNTICKLLGLCASKIKNVNHDSSNGVTCDFCQYAMGKLDAILTDNATEAEIKQAVENLCAKFPSAVAGECKILIDRYGDMIISMLAQELKPSVICQALGLCTEKITAKFTKLKKKHFLSMRQEVKGVSCSVCEYAMGYLDKELETKNVETKIEQEIQVLCKKLPSAFSNECDALITEYGDDLIKLVVEQMEPAEVCKILKLC